MRGVGGSAARAVVRSTGRREGAEPGAAAARPQCSAAAAQDRSAELGLSGRRADMRNVVPVPTHQPDPARSITLNSARGTTWHRLGSCSAWALAADVTFPLMISTMLPGAGGPPSCAWEHS